MSDGGWHYWLFEGERGKPPLPVTDLDEKVFTSLERARKAAQSLGRVIDIYRTPAAGGASEYVEAVNPPQRSRQPSEERTGEEQTNRGNPVKGTITQFMPMLTQAMKGRVSKALEDRIRTVNAHVRKLAFHPPTDPANPVWYVEVEDESGHVIASGAGDDAADAYLELWEDIKPHD